MGPIGMVSAVVLAADTPERIGEQKLLVPLMGKPALQWVLEGGLASEVREIICVVRDLETVRRQIMLVDERLSWLVHNSANGGLSSSIIAGLWAVDPKSDGVVYLAGDQPFIQSELIDALIERFENSKGLIVAPSYQGQTRNPMLFRREIFPDLLRLTGDQSGFALFEKYRDRAELVPWPDGVPFMDIDARADYERLKELV